MLTLGAAGGEAGGVAYGAGPGVNHCATASTSATERAATAVASPLTTARRLRLLPTTGGAGAGLWCEKTRLSFSGVVVLCRAPAGYKFGRQPGARSARPAVES